MNTVAERLAYALAIRGMTQSELARRAGVTRGTISNVMKGVAKISQLRSLSKLQEHWTLILIG